MRILLADDDRLMRMLVSVSLDCVEGIDITEACDGTEAWNLLRREYFDVVLLDWLMPGISGLKIVRDARAAGMHVPIVMMTAEAKKDRVVEAIRSGVSDYIVKPFDTSTLWAKLKRVCPNSPRSLCGTAE